jgi:hypothetical protein
MTEAENRRGHVPLELCRRDDHTNIRIAGFGRLKFPEDAKILDVDGNARRIEWLPSEKMALELMEQYNRPSRDPLFQIANDLVEQQQLADLESQFGKIIGDLRARVDECEKGVSDIKKSLGIRIAQAIKTALTKKKPAKDDE